MPDPKTLSYYAGVLSSVKDILFKIPGVVRIGFGLKEKNNELLSEYVCRVYVSEKKPKEAVSPAELIPSEINGLKTDVIEFREQHPASSCETIINPGMEITKVVFNVPGIGSGSIGCFLKKDGDTNRYLLTNDHVLTSEQEMAPREKRIFQPKLKKSAGRECNDPVAFVVEDTKQGGVTILNGGMLVHEFAGKKFDIDCRIATVASEVVAVNRVDKIGPLSGFFDFSTITITPGSPILVKKKGAATGITDGKIKEFFFINEDGDTIHQIAIDPDGPAVSNYDKTFTVADDEVDSILRKFGAQPVKAELVSGSTNKIRFKGKVFCNKGDSGSVLLFKDGDKFKVAGLITMVSGEWVTIPAKNDSEFIPGGIGFAGFIFPILNFLRFPTADSSLIIPSGESSDDRVLLPGEELGWTGVRTESRMAKFGVLEKKLTNTEKGQKLLQAFQPHVTEVINLVHHKKPVSLSWYRSKGPAFAGMFIKNIEDFSGQFSKQIESINLKEAAITVALALRKYGSRELCELLDEHQDFLLETMETCSSYEDLIRMFEKSDTKQLINQE
jgi:hypothetical protein